METYSKINKEQESFFCNLQNNINKRKAFIDRQIETLKQGVQNSQISSHKTY